MALQNELLSMPLDPFEGSEAGTAQDNIFDFIDSLSLHDLDLPVLDGPLVSGEQASFAHDLAPLDQDVPQPPNSSSENASSEQDEPKKTSPARPRSQSRVDRIREKNRNAQARFRQKQREERHRLDQQTTAVQAALQEALEARSQRQAQHVKLTKRVADITGELLDVRNEQLEASNVQQTFEATGSFPRQGSDSVSQTTSGTGAAKALTYADAGHSQVSVVPRHRPGWPLYRRDRMTPRALDTWQHFKGIAYTDIVDINCVCTGGSIGAAETFRQAQAVELGCDADNVCLFAQMGVEVARQVPLSYSATLSSPECAASFVLNFVTTSFTHALCLHVLEKQKGNHGAPAHTCSLCGTSAATDALAEDLFSSSRKRARSSAAARTPQATSQPGSQLQDASMNATDQSFEIDISSFDMGDLPSGATSEQRFLASAVAAGLPAMHVRCGVNEKYPLVPAVTHLLTEALNTVDGVLGEDVIDSVCRVLIVQGEQMILHNDDQSKSIENLAPEDKAFFERVSHHLCAVILTTGAVLRRFLMRPSKQAVPVTTEALEETQERLEQRMVHLTHASSMGDKLSFIHATRLMFNLTSDAICPLMAAYEVDNLTYCMYKDMGLTQPQKEQLGVLWTIWESRKRHLDDEMLRAKSILSSLPSSVPVPFHILSQLTLLTRPPTDTPSPSHHTQHKQQEHVLELRSHALESPLDSSTATVSTDHSGSAQNRPQGEREALQCLGQDGDATAAAAEGMRHLCEVHRADAILLPTTIDDVVDCAPNANMFNCRQFSKLCCGHLRYQTVVPDIMALAQLASMQCKRADLFRIVRH